MHLFAFGSNGSGQLGLGHTDDVSTPTPCLFSQEKHTSDHDGISDNDHAGDDCVVRIVAGGNHTLLLTKRGNVYAAGYNGDGRCGVDSTAYASFASAGKNGKMKKNGGNEEEEEGEAEGENLLRFRRILLPYPTTSNTTSCINSNSDSLIRKFKFIAATWEASILVAEVRKGTGISTVEPRHNAQAKPESHHHQAGPEFEDVVFVLGTGSKGELGLGHGQNNISPSITSSSPSHLSSSPLIIPHFPPRDTKVTALESGMGHCIAVLSNGDVYGWGAARKGQLGDAHRGTKIVWTPSRISDIRFPASGAACGREFTVVVAHRQQGHFVVLGDRGNKWRILDDVPSSFARAHPDAGPGGAAFTSILAGWNAVYVHAAPSPLPPFMSGLTQAVAAAAEEKVITSSDDATGSLIAWGRNDRGQLPPRNLPTPIQLAVGSEHVLALLGDGTVAAFGWGEHGNCGPDTDSRGNVAGTYNVIAPPEVVRSGSVRVVGVGAGCATSWIIVA